MGKGGHSSDKKKHDPMISYKNTVNKVTKWYERLILLREKEPVIINPNTKQETKRKELKPLQYYLDKIVKPKG